MKIANRVVQSPIGVAAKRSSSFSISRSQRNHNNESVLRKIFRILPFLVCALPFSVSQKSLDVSQLGSRLSSPLANPLNISLPFCSVPNAFWAVQDTQLLNRIDEISNEEAHPDAAFRSILDELEKVKNGDTKTIGELAHFFDSLYRGIHGALQGRLSEMRWIEQLHKQHPIFDIATIRKEYNAAVPRNNEENIMRAKRGDEHAMYDLNERHRHESPITGIEEIRAEHWKNIHEYHAMMMRRHFS